MTECLHYDARIASASLTPAPSQETFMSTPPRVDYQTHPSQYRHWKLKFEGPVATLAADRKSVV